MRRLATAAVLLSLRAAAGGLSELERTIVQDAWAVLQREVEGGQHCAAPVAGSFEVLAEPGLRAGRPSRAGHAR